MHHLSRGISHGNNVSGLENIWSIRSPVRRHRVPCFVKDLPPKPWLSCSRQPFSRGAVDLVANKSPTPAFSSLERYASKIQPVIVVD